MILNRLNLIILIACLLIIAGLGCYTFVLHSKLESISDYKTLYESKSKENKVWKDQYGYWRNRAETVEITKENLQDIKELQHLSSEFEGLKKNLKNLETYINANTVTEIHKTVKLRDSTIYSVDSVPIRIPVFSYKDKWESVRGAIVDDSITLNISHMDSLSIVQYWDRRWLLAKKKYFIEIKSDNPNTRIVYQKSIMVKRKKGLF